MRRKGKGAAFCLTKVLGLPLETAVARLKKEGYQVETVETRSRKGVDGDTFRVVRQRDISDGSGLKISLVYCCFKTKVMETL